METYAINHIPFGEIPKLYSMTGLIEDDPYFVPDGLDISPLNREKMFVTK